MYISAHLGEHSAYQPGFTVPGRGLGNDQVHMTTFYSHDYSDPMAFSRGHALHNLTALMMLDTIWKEVILAAS